MYRPCYSIFTNQRDYQEHTITSDQHQECKRLSHGCYPNWVMINANFVIAFHGLYTITTQQQPSHPFCRVMQK